MTQRFEPDGTDAQVEVYDPNKVYENNVRGADADAAVVGTDYALVIGNPWGAAHAILGSLDDIDAWLDRAKDAVRAARALGPCEPRTPCGECGWLITDANVSEVSDEHDRWCSLHPTAAVSKPDDAAARWLPVGAVLAVDDDEDAGDAMVDVEAVMELLRAAGVPYTSIATGGGAVTVYVGDGDWDEGSERFTHPLSIGPCFHTVNPAMRDRGVRLFGNVGELYYGPREDGVGVFEPTAPSVIADALRNMHQS